MTSDSAGTISVIDFRRHGMVLQWHALGGTWTAYDNPPPLVHGIALIRASQPNVCLYAQAGRLRLQVGPSQYALSENSPRITYTRGISSFGFRRRFTVASSSHGQDFFGWLAAKAEDPDWRVASGRKWSEGVASAELRLG
jgi:hypothetical protein